MIHGIARLAQTLAQVVGDLSVIFDEEDAHAIKKITAIIA